MSSADTGSYRKPLPQEAQRTKVWVTPWLWATRGHQQMRGTTSPWRGGWGRPCRCVSSLGFFKKGGGVGWKTGGPCKYHSTSQTTFSNVVKGSIYKKKIKTQWLKMIIIHLKQSPPQQTSKYSNPGEQLSKVELNGIMKKNYLLWM